MCLFATLFIASLCLDSFLGTSSFVVDCNFVYLSGLEVRGLHGIVTLDKPFVP